LERRRPRWPSFANGSDAIPRAGNLDTGFQEFQFPRHPRQDERQDRRIRIAWVAESCRRRRRIDRTSSSRVSMSQDVDPTGVNLTQSIARHPGDETSRRSRSSRLVRRCQVFTTINSESYWCDVDRPSRPTRPRRRDRSSRSRRDGSSRGRRSRLRRRRRLCRYSRRIRRCGHRLRRSGRSPSSRRSRSTRPRCRTRSRRFSRSRGGRRGCRVRPNAARAARSPPPRRISKGRHP